MFTAYEINRVHKQLYKMSDTKLPYSGSLREAPARWSGCQTDSLAEKVLLRHFLTFCFFHENCLIYTSSNTSCFINRKSCKNKHRNRVLYHKRDQKNTTFISQNPSLMAIYKNVHVYQTMHIVLNYFLHVYRDFMK